MLVLQPIFSNDKIIETNTELCPAKLLKAVSIILLKLVPISFNCFNRFSIQKAGQRNIKILVIY